MGVFHYLNVLILTVWCHEKNCLMLQQMNKLFQISNFLPSPLCVQCGLTCATLASLIVWLNFAVPVCCPQRSASSGCGLCNSECWPPLFVSANVQTNSAWMLESFIWPFLCQWLGSRIFTTPGILQLLVELNSSCPNCALVFATGNVIQSEIKRGVGSAQASFLWSSYLESHRTSLCNQTFKKNCVDGPWSKFVEFLCLCGCVAQFTHAVHYLTI